MPLISHRGAAGLASANSQEAITLAQRYSPDFIEVDINCTSDGVLVVYHGSMVRFMRGKRARQTYNELKSSYPSLQTLDEFVSILHTSCFMFDIKISDEEDLKQTILRLHKYPAKFAFTSPHQKALLAMKKEFPDSLIFQSQPYHHGPISALEIARRNKFQGIALNKWWMTPIIYQLCKMHRKRLMCYTVDSRIGIRIVGTLFPDVYLVTNRPDIYRQFFPGK